MDDGLRMEVIDNAGLVFIDLHGTLRHSEADQLVAAAKEVLAGRPRNLQLGLLRLGLLQYGGLAALLEVRMLAAAANVPLQLLGLSLQARRLLDLTGLLEAFDIIE